MSNDKLANSLVQDFLSELRSLNVRLWVDGHNLRYKAPKGKLTANHIEQLRVYKAEILAFFLQQSQCSSAISIQTKGNKTPFFFVNSVGHAKRLSSYLDSDQPFYGLSIFGALDKLTSNDSSNLIQEIATCFIYDMKRIQPTGPYRLAAFCRDSKLASEIAKQLTHERERISLLLYIDVIWGEQSNRLYYYWLGCKSFGIRYTLQKSIDWLTLWFKNSRIRPFQNNHIHSLNQLEDPENGTENEKLSDKLFLQNYCIAADTYTPSFYPGKIVSILSKELAIYDNSILSSLVKYIETHEINALHQLLFEEPYIQCLGEKINEFLLLDNSSR